MGLLMMIICDEHKAKRRLNPSATLRKYHSCSTRVMQ